jgi:hypothetical protein
MIVATACFRTIFRRFSVLDFLVDIGKSSVYLQRRSAASSLRSTLLGGAGWHRADFAEARTLDVE